MKTLLLVLALAVLPCAASAESFRYFSMNLHCALGDWRARVDQVIDEVARTQPDVAGFQEVCDGKNAHMADYMVHELEKRGYHVAFSKAVDTHKSFFKYQEQLLLISKHPADSVETGKLPSMPFLLNRYVAARIADQWIVTTHLHFLLPQIRKSQYKKLRKLFTARRAIIFGDMNSSDRSGESKPLSKAGWIPFFAGPTYPSDKPKKVFDGFWTSPSLSNDIEAAWSRRAFLGAKDQPSDHLGVELILQFLDK